MKELTSDIYLLASFHGGEGNIELVCHKDKIVVPPALQSQIVEWYHSYLGHPGINRTEQTIKQHFWWEEMRQHITKYVATCGTCQKNKTKYKKYGLVLPKIAETKPWERLCVDLIGPYTIRQKTKGN